MSVSHSVRIGTFIQFLAHCFPPYLPSVYEGCTGLCLNGFLCLLAWIYIMVTSFEMKLLILIDEFHNYLVTWMLIWSLKQLSIGSESNSLNIFLLGLKSWKYSNKADVIEKVHYTVTTDH